MTARILEIAAVTLLAVAGFALAALYLGQELSWDLKNYHYYNPYALLNGRLLWDIQPAMRQTYFNPLLDVPFYYLATYTSPLVTSLALAAFQSLTLVLTYFICRELLRNSGGSVAEQMVLALALAGVGVLSPVSIYEVGHTAGDNTSGVFILGALLCLLIWLRKAGSQPQPSRQSWLLPVLGGVLAGAGVGLKLTNGPYALALVLAFLLIGVPWRTKFRTTLGFGVGGIAGVAATAGYWWWTLYSAFGNPLFPQFNHIFRSPFIDPVPFADQLFKGETLLATLFYPFYYNVFAGNVLHDWTFRDVRLPMLFVLAVVCLGVLIWRWATARSDHSERVALRPHRFFFFFIVISYVLWLQVFSIIRYALLIEVLAPVACFTILMLLRVPRRRTLAIMAGILAAFLLTYHHQPAVRLPWSESFFEVALPESEELEGALVVIAGHEPVAYLIPFFPASTRFVRISGNLFYEGDYQTLEERYANRTGEWLRAAVAQHTGVAYAMFKEDERAQADTDLAYFGLALDPNDPGAAVSEYGTERPVMLYRLRKRTSGVRDD